MRARPTPLDRSPLHLLHRAQQAADQIFAAKIANGITPRQILVLQLVGEQEGLSQTELVRRSGVDRSTLSDVIRRLKRAGLVDRRRSSEDARAWQVKLTSAGQAALKDCSPTLKQIEAAITASLPARREAFLANLQAIIEAFPLSHLPVRKHAHD